MTPATGMAQDAADAAAWPRDPAAELLPATLLFTLADILFGSFGTAHVFAQFGITGVFAFMIGWQLVSTTAYVASVYRFGSGERYAARALRAGIGGMLLAMVLAGLLLGGCARGLAGGLSCQSGFWPSVWVLAVLGGGSRGVAFSARTWLELHHTRGPARQAYLARTEAAGTVLKLLVPLGAAIVLATFEDDFAVFFIGAGLGGLTLLPVLRSTQLGTAPAAPRAPWALLRQRDYWHTAPFYVVDGAGHALRTGLFVSGAMAVVGSATRYSYVEMTASVFAALLLWWQSHRPAIAPSLVNLRWSLALLALAWTALLASLRQPLLLPVFVGAYAISHPLVTVVKSGLTLKGLAQVGAPPQDNLIARMLLLTLGRIGALGLAWFVSATLQRPTLQLLGTCLLAVLVLPLEYRYAARLSRSR